MKEFKVGIIGFGTVGAGVADCLLNNADAIAKRTGVKPVLAKIADLDITTDRGVKVPAGILTTDAQELIDSVLIKFRKRYPGQSVSVDIPEEFVMVPMDAVLICQVFTNLLENAALHGGGTRNITVSAEVRGRSACFCVEDDGAGIGEDALPYLFEDRPSLRSAPADSGGRHNMGIGLSVCRAIVKAHGGTMEAQSVPGRGARFCFTLPLDE